MYILHVFNTIENATLLMYVTTRSDILKTISILKVALGVAIILTLSILFYFYHKKTAIALDGHAANSFFSEYIVPLSGSGITNKYTDYDIKYGIDDGETIVLHVIIKNLMTVNKNTDFNDKNTIHHNNSKTLISYSSNIYTDKYLKYISEDTIKATSEKLKTYIVHPAVFTNYRRKSVYSTKQENNVSQ